MGGLKILIVEDETRIAKRIKRLTEEILADRIELLILKNKFHTALEYIRHHSIDLLLLDLNLSGQNGFDLLKTVLAESFSTIIISAYKEKAIEAFEYGVLDFVPKPFRKERLEQAFNRVIDQTVKSDTPIKKLAIKRQGRIKLISIPDLLYIKGANIYSELYLKNGNKALSDKSLETLLQLLPTHFTRIHKSYIANMSEAIEIIVNPGGKYELKMKDDLFLPIGRTRYKEIRASYSM